MRDKNMKRNNMKKINLIFASLLMIAIFAAGCTSSKSDAGSKQDSAVADTTVTTAPTAEITEKPTEIMIAAASSLEYALDEKLIPTFEEQNPGITVKGTYDSSGKLQTQIEEGMDADIFFSAATTQMDALNGEKLIKSDSIVNLLKNKIVLIVPSNSTLGITKFEDIVKAKKIAIGDPDSVPAGQYAKEAYTNLRLWDKIAKKASYGTNVTEVLGWVSEGSADAGVVYATDAVASPDGIKVVAEAPSGSLKSDIIYPVAILKNSTKQEAAQKFVDFLSTEEAMTVFGKYGFINNTK